MAHLPEGDEHGQAFRTSLSLPRQTPDGRLSVILTIHATSKVPNGDYEGLLALRGSPGIAVKPSQIPIRFTQLSLWEYAWLKTQPARAFIRTWFLSASWRAFCAWPAALLLGFVLVNVLLGIRRSGAVGVITYQDGRKQHDLRRGIPVGILSKGNQIEFKNNPATSRQLMMTVTPLGPTIVTGRVIESSSRRRKSASRRRRSRRPPMGPRWRFRLETHVESERTRPEIFLHEGSAREEALTGRSNTIEVSRSMTFTAIIGEGPGKKRYRFRITLTV
jgi:hypothetical protein